MATTLSNFHEEIMSKSTSDRDIAAKAGTTVAAIRSYRRRKKLKGATTETKKTDPAKGTQVTVDSSKKNKKTAAPKKAAAKKAKAPKKAATKRAATKVLDDVEIPIHLPANKKVCPSCDLEAKSEFKDIHEKFGWRTVKVKDGKKRIPQSNCRECRKKKSRAAKAAKAASSEAPTQAAAAK